MDLGRTKGTLITSKKKTKRLPSSLECHNAIHGSITGKVLSFTIEIFGVSKVPTHRAFVQEEVSNAVIKLIDSSLKHF